MFPVADLISHPVVKDTIGGNMVTVRYHASTHHPQVTDADHQTIPSVTAFWFAWQAFYPKS